MTVYINDLNWETTKGDIYGFWFELTGDSDTELYGIVNQLNLQFDEVQGIKSKNQWEHIYYLSESERKKAIRLGAKEISWRDGFKRSLNETLRLKEEK